MRILFTGVYSHLYGGLERFAERAAAKLRENGHEVITVGDVPEKLEDVDYVLMHKVPKRAEDLRRLKSKYGEALHFYAHDHELYCLRRHYYDPMRKLCERTYSFFPCRLCAAVTRPQWIFSNISRDITTFINEMRKVKTFVASNYMKNNLIKNGFNPDKIKILYPTFVRPKRDEAAKHAWMANGELNILYMGQLVAGKGVGVLIDAVKLMKTPYRLSIVGAGRDEKKLVKRANDRISFLGWRNDAQSLCATADVCAVPSLWNEPFGMVGAEALSHGVGVVAFNVGGISDLLVPGKTGFFARERSAKALAEALDKMADKKLLARISENALDLVEKLFDPDKFINTLLER